jgi:SAM-dependent methyltransferase
LKELSKFHTSHTEVEADILHAALAPGSRVLEAGCGRTTRLSDFRDRIDRLVGADIDEAGGRSNAALDEFVVADLCCTLPFAAGAFDVVYANFVVEHLEHPGHAFAEWHRVLRPGGSVILLTSNVANPLMTAARIVPQPVRTAVKRLGPGAAARDVFPARYRANTPGVLSRLLRQAGFAPVSVVFVATLHRYVSRHRLAAAALRNVELLPPPRLRSTIIAWYQRGDGSAQAASAPRSPGG